MRRHLIGILLALVFAGLPGNLAAQAAGVATASSASSAPFAARDFTALVGTPGFSPILLENHFKLYQGYVKNAGSLLEELDRLRKDGKERTPAFAESKRRFGWEFNGMRLHELFFENLGGKASLAEDSPLRKRLAVDFGSFDEWLKDFRATCLMRGIGWCALVLDPVSGRLMNAWINEHDGGVPAGCRILLILDVFEHAFLTDYGLDRAKYLEAALAAVKWEEVERRFATGRP